MLQDPTFWVAIAFVVFVVVAIKPVVSKVGAMLDDKSAAIGAQLKEAESLREEAQAALQKKHVHPFDITGRAMKGWVMVAQEGFAKKADLRRWLNLSRQFVQTLPAK